MLKDAVHRSVFIASHRLAETPGKLTFIKVDVDDGEDIVEKVGISSMPTFKVFRKGKEVESFTGAESAKLQVRACVGGLRWLRRWSGEGRRWFW